MFEQEKGYKPFKLSDQFVERYKDIKPPFGFNGLGELVYRRTYSRLIDGRNEEWFETIRRVVEGCYNMQKKHVEFYNLGWNAHRAQFSAQEMYDRMFNMKFLPGGRGLWAMGTAITEERGTYLALSNCAFVSTANIKEDPSKPFCFLMDVSMLGAGCGTDMLGAGKILIKGPNQNRNPEVFIIPDSREGWVESLKLLLESYFYGPAAIKFDYSQIRVAGEPIKGFGGISSGPEPLQHMHSKITDILEKNIGNMITSTTIADIMNLIGKCVVAGNVRRSSEIILGDAEDSEYINLKNSQVNPERCDPKEGWAWASNNSIAAKIGMDYSDVAKRTVVNGEPGYVWLENLRGYSRMNNGLDNKDHRASGVNPCLTADTWIDTTEGPRQIKDLIDNPFYANVHLNKNAIGKSNSGFFLTKKDAPVFLLTTKEGFSIRTTEDHKFYLSEKKKWCAARDIVPTDKISLNSNNLQYWPGDGTFGEGYILGVLFGDGTFSDLSPMSIVWTHENKTGHIGIMQQVSEILEKSPEKTKDWKFLPKTKRYNLQVSYFKNITEKFQVDKRKIINEKIEKGCSEFYQGFLRGFFDADGYIQGTQEKGISIRLSQSDILQLKAVQRMLLRIGIYSRIYRRKEAGTEIMPDSNRMPKTYHTKAKYELIISNDAIKVFSDVVGFANIDKKGQLENSLVNYKRQYNKTDFTATFLDLLEDGREDVYDCTIEELHYFSANGIISHNCAEIFLESAELCNLIEVFPLRNESKEDFLRTLKYAYLYAKTVTLGQTHWQETNRVVLRNRRIGASISGIQQFIAKNGIDTLKVWCEDGYNEIRRWDETYSDWLAIPRSIKITTVKPSGSISLLAGATSGVHFPEGRFFIKRVRIAKNSPLIRPLKKAGYNIEDAIGDKYTCIVSFPVDVGLGVRSVKEVSAWEKTAIAAFMQKYWSDNAVSTTVDFDPETEGNQIEKILDIYQYQLKTVSFLPRIDGGAYPQMPQEEITEDQYREIAKSLKPINFEAVTLDAEAELYCTTDTCLLTEDILAIERNTEGETK